MQLMNSKPALTARQRGFSLVELMIASVLGLMLIGGTITIFTGGVRSSDFSQALANLQSSARFAVDIMRQDVRMAGFQGCANPNEVVLSISATNTPTNNLGDTAIFGAAITDTGWVPALPQGFVEPTGAGAPASGTDALIVQYTAGFGYEVSDSMTAVSSAIEVDASNNDGIQLFDGDLAVISNCDAAELFEVSSISGSATKLIQPGQALSQAYSLKDAADRTLRVSRFVSAVYYIGDTTRTNSDGDAIRSLYLQTWPYDAPNNPAIELIEGVDQMQLSFGVRQASGDRKSVV